MQTNFVITTYAQQVLFYSVVKKSRMSSFSIAKMVAIYAKIDRVGSLGAVFHERPLVQNFWNVHNIIMEC